MRHRGFKTISRSFATKKEAQEFLAKASRIANAKIVRRKDSNALNKLRGEK